MPVVLIGGLGHVTGAVILAVVITGIVCSAVAFSLQLWGQRCVEPSRAAVILLFEPVVAGFVGFFVGERLGVKRLCRRARDPRRHRDRRIALLAVEASVTGVLSCSLERRISRTFLDRSVKERQNAAHG